MRANHGARDGIPFEGQGNAITAQVAVFGATASSAQRLAAAHLTTDMVLENRDLQITEGKALRDRALASPSPDFARRRILTADWHIAIIAGAITAPLPCDDRDVPRCYQLVTRHSTWSRPRSTG
jgi:hypothetical protein